MNNLDYRYEIIGAFDHGGCDLEEHAATKAEAFRRAASYLKRHRDGDKECIDMNNEYLQLSNKVAREITDDQIVLFSELMKKDDRVISCAFVHRDVQQRPIFNVNINFGQGEMLKGDYSFGSIAGLLHECNHERSVRVPAEAERQRLQKLARDNIYNSIALAAMSKLRKQIKRVNRLVNNDCKITKRHLLKAINAYSQGYRMTKRVEIAAHLVSNKKAIWNNEKNMRGWHYIIKNYNLI